MLVEACEHDHAGGQQGDAAEQVGDGRRSAGNARGDDETSGGMIGPAPRQPVEQHVAPFRKIHAAQPRQFAGPAGDDDFEHRQRCLPVAGQVIGQGQIAQRGDGDALHLHLVQHRAQRLPQLQRLPRVHACLHILHHAAKDHLAAHRRDGGRDGVPLPQRIERAADLFAKVGIADGDEAGEQQPAARRAHESVADGADRAVAGQQDHALRQRHRIGPVARDQPGDQRVGKGPVGGDGMERWAHGISHGPDQPWASMDSTTGMARGVPTSNHSP